MRRRAALLALLGAVACGGAAHSESTRIETLRVCADPNNLPFSNDRGEGFENRLAEMLADALGADLEYTWWAQRRGYVRNTLRAGLCDVLLGVPTSFELAQATRPYYRSAYVFLTRRDDALEIAELDDPRLRTLRIGVHVVGDDYTNTPPAHALARRGIVENVRGYSLYGDYSKPNPPAALIEAVANGEVDVGIVWGPFAGYFAPLQTTPLEYRTVEPQVDLPFLPFVYDIAVGVRRGDSVLAAVIEGVLGERSDEVDDLLREFGVPRVGNLETAVAATPDGAHR